MRISQAIRTGSAATARGASGGASRGGGFQVGGPAEAPQTAATRGPATVSSLETILALQSVEEAGERKRRAARQGNEALDLLDDMRIALLSGRLSPESADKLRGLIRQWEGHERDPALADILKQIDLRARVEIAKLDKTFR